MWGQCSSSERNHGRKQIILVNSLFSELGKDCNVPVLEGPSLNAIQETRLTGLKFNFEVIT